MMPVESPRGDPKEGDMNMCKRRPESSWEVELKASEADRGRINHCFSCERNRSRHFRMQVKHVGDNQFD